MINVCNQRTTRKMLPDLGRERNKVQRSQKEQGRKKTEYQGIVSKML